MTFTNAFVWIAAAWWLVAIGFLCLTLAAAFLQPFVQRRRARRYAVRFTALPSLRAAATPRHVS